MKKLIPFLLLMLTCEIFAQQAVEIPVSLKTPDGKYIGQVSGGGLDASANSVSAKQTFILVDINGGKIADGDLVKIKFDASQWHEDKEKSIIHRVSIKGSKEDECIFKLRVYDKLIFFETASGKFVKVEDIAVIATKEAQNATLFDVQAVIPNTQPTNYKVAFLFATGSYLGIVAGGGLEASSKEISNKNIFSLIDLNGGNLSNGDMVKIIYEQSQMNEDKENNKIHRVPIKGSNESECVFKIVVSGRNILLQAPSGKYVGITNDAKSLIPTDKINETSLIMAVPNPTPKVQ